MKTIWQYLTHRGWASRRVAGLITAICGHIPNKNHEPLILLLKHMFTSPSNHIKPLKPLNLSKFAVRIPQPFLTTEIGSHGSPHLSALERTTKAFSPSVERRALRTLRQLCEELLQRCPEERRQSDARIMAEPELLQRLPTKDHGGWMRLGSEGEGNRPVFHRI